MSKPFRCVIIPYPGSTFDAHFQCFRFKVFGATGVSAPMKCRENAARLPRLQLSRCEVEMPMHPDAILFFIFFTTFLFSAFLYISTP